MLKLIKSKQAVSDVTLMWTIILIFFMLGILLPFVNSGFAQTSQDFNTGDLETGLDDETNFTKVSSITILSSIGKMFFWTFGTLPFWLDGIFVVFRAMLALLIYRQIRSGGG